MSAAGLEGVTVVDAIIAILAADTGPTGVATATGGRIYDDVVPVGTVRQAYPIVNVSLLAAQSDITADGTHVWQRVTVLTKVTTTGNDQRSSRRIAARIVSLLDGIERYVYTPKDQAGAPDPTMAVYLHKIRHVETVAQPPDVANSTRYNYVNLTWFTEAEPAS